MFGFYKENPQPRKRHRSRPSLEALDQRVVPAVAASFDPRTLLAQGAAERAITGRDFSTRTQVARNVNRLVRGFNRFEAVTTRRLNRLTNVYNTRIQTLNNQFVNQVVNTANMRIGEFFGPGQAIDGAFLNQFNSRNTGLNLDPNKGFVSTVTTTNPLGQFSGPGRVLGGNAFINRFNARLDQLNDIVTTRLSSVSQVVASRYNLLNAQFARVGSPFDAAVTNLGKALSTRLASTSQAFTQGLAASARNFTAAFDNFNTLLTSPATVAGGFNQFATNLGDLFGQFNEQFNAGQNEFATSFNRSQATFDEGFRTGLGSFYEALNSQYNTISPVVGAPVTGFAFAPGPGLIVPGGVFSTTTAALGL